MWYFKEKEGDFVRDFKMFTTENGVASLVLRQIPYRKNAYITVQCAADPEALLAECVQFCIAAGAETVYGTGHRILEQYPHFVDIITMERKTDLQEAAGVALIPVEEASLEKWRLLYNIKMEMISFGAFLDRREAEELFQGEALYFAYRNKELLGIGSVSGNVIRTVASLRPGAGELIVRALCMKVCSDTVKLEVASDNLKAIALYEKMGFIAEENPRCWYILNKKDQA